MELIAVGELINYLYRLILNSELFGTGLLKAASVGELL